MDRHPGRPLLPGASVLGGASCGLSYEGLMRDAVAQEERSRRSEAGRSRGRVPTPVQLQRPEPDLGEQAQVAGH